MTTATTLTDAEVEDFIENGYVHLRGAVAPDVVRAGCDILWHDMGLAADRPDGWSQPVRRLLPSDDGPFRAAFTSPAIAPALDRLVGAGRWQPRPNLGNFVIRFPHSEEPSDTGWHVEGSFLDSAPGGTDSAEYRVNVESRGRSLLMLFLYSDVGANDGPTRIRPGSHRDVVPLLRGVGPPGLPFSELARRATDASADRPTALATGDAGDVYLCHPFLVHAAQAHHGTRPRLMAQPPLAPREPVRLERADGDYSPVEQAIRRVL